MKFGMRTPSLKRSISARTTGQLKRSVKRAIIPGYGKKGVQRSSRKNQGNKKIIYRLQIVYTTNKKL